MFKNVLTAAAAATVMFAGASVQAAGVFTVNPTGVSAAYTNPLGTFQSDYIAGNYSEVITLTAATATTGSFAYSLLWRGTGFELAGSPVQDALFNSTGVSTGLANTYTLYATLQGSGTYSVSGSTVTFAPALGGLLNLYSDVGGIGITAPATGAGAYSIIADDPRLLLSGSVQAASGQLKPGVGNDFGSFGVVTDVTLASPNGEAFFTQPRPFFNVSFEAGNFNSYWLDLGALVVGNSVTQTVGGGAQLTFGRIPEPSALALVGLALIGAAVARRRRV